MRTLEAIDRELAAAEEELAKAEGTPTEVYSRIVGYYRSVRNWNRGKREEYGQRVEFSTAKAEAKALAACPRSTEGGKRVLLFVRASCPACPGAKAAAARLGLPVELVDADDGAGLAAAERLQVLSTPTAILFDGEGRELGRARDARSIAAFAPSELLPASSQ